METMDRISRIKGIAEDRQQAKDNELSAKKNKIATLLEKVRSFAPRMHELMKVGRALYDAGIPLGEDDPDNPGARECGDVEFVTNGWSHRVGFVAAVRINGHIPSRGQNLPVGFGICGGGAAGESIEFNEDGELEFLRRPFGKPAGVSGRPWDDKDIRHLERFVAQFDDFEKKFYEYVDNLK